jgi:DNA invertase Pin-like site-specific DNA recombinase
MKRKRAAWSAGFLIGYARVSTHEQNLDLQRAGLRKAGYRKIFTDTVSRSVKTREGLRICLVPSLW